MVGCSEGAEGWIPSGNSGDYKPSNMQYHNVLVLYMPCILCRHTVNTPKNILTTTVDQ